MSNKNAGDLVVTIPRYSSLSEQLRCKSIYHALWVVPLLLALAVFAPVVLQIAAVVLGFYVLAVVLGNGQVELLRHFFPECVEKKTDGRRDLKFRLTRIPDFFVGVATMVVVPMALFTGFNVIKEQPEHLWLPVLVGVLWPCILTFLIFAYRAIASRVVAIHKLLKSIAARIDEHITN